MSPSARFRQRTYGRLFASRPFATFWTAALVSPFGDRLTAVALAVLVLNESGSPLLVGLVAAASLLPNLLVGPFAGVLADRLPRRTALVGSDLARAGLVLAIPVGIVVNPILAVPIVFTVSASGLVFRAAKTAAVADIVGEDELMAANGATMTADSVADLLGYPVAGVLVVAFSGSLWVAFALDAVTYLLSAALLATLRFNPPVPPDAVPNVRRELRAGWDFLRRDRALLENTVLSMVAQLSIGLNIALLVVFAAQVLHDPWMPYPGNFAAIETAIGIGAVIGGIAVGSIGNRHEGAVILVGFATMGLLQTAMALSSTLLFAVPLIACEAIANLVWLVPTQTLFLTRTPRELIGRIVALRGALTFGAMTLAMLVGSAIAVVVPVQDVLVAGGLLTIAAALVGCTRPALLRPETVPQDGHVVVPAITVSRPAG